MLGIMSSVWGAIGAPHTLDIIPSIA